MTGLPRVLVVEDSPDVAALVTGALDRVARVTTAGSLAEALAAAGRESPDVVVCDLGLPDATGAGVVAALAAAVPGATIVVVTGDPSPGTAASVLAAGAAACLPKDAILDGTLVASVRARASVEGSAADGAP